MEWLLGPTLSFIETGGVILWIVFAVSTAAWALMLERLWFYYKQYPQLRSKLVAEWQKRKDKVSVQAELVRELYLSSAEVPLRRNMPTLRALIAITPLCGLLGTVTGMIEVFDVMAVIGSGDPRAMASGVSKATMPTMAAMAIAVCGLVGTSRLERAINKESLALNRLFSRDGGVSSGEVS